MFPLCSLFFHHVFIDLLMMFHDVGWSFHDVWMRILSMCYFSKAIVSGHPLLTGVLTGMMQSEKSSQSQIVGHNPVVGMHLGDCLPPLVA